MSTKKGSERRIDKPSMAYAVATLQLQSRHIDSDRVRIAELRRQLTSEPDCLSGNRAETYQEILDMVDGFAAKVAEATLVMRNEASKRNELFHLEVDFKQIDAKASDSLAKTKAMRAKKLKGQ